MKNVFSSAHPSKRLKILVSAVTLALILGLAVATVFTMYYAQNTATVKTPDVRLGAGPDGSGGSTSPNASVSVSSTYDYATVAFTIFPSATNTPQPATYYTNLLNISNVGSSSHTIKAITVTALSGQSNLGNITIYYYATQTDDPTAATAIGSASLTSGSSAPVSVFSGTQSIAASATQYIEVVGFAASGASADSTVTFTVSIQWV
jgi:hypothetical protein